MTITHWVVVAFWIFFVVYWAISAIGVKKNLGMSRSWRREIWLRILILVVVIVLINLLPSLRQFSGFAFGQTLFAFNQTLSITWQWIGVALCAVGIAFAVWARRHLGRNWSGTPSVKVGHELVTSGPYRFVRHPIYTGIITALIGSALVGGVPWLLVAVIAGAMFVWRVGVEEKIMTGLFPAEYPDYKKKTKALIPFVW